jgi:hypothetical protein
MGVSLPIQIEACFNAMETSQFTFNQNVYGSAISWEGHTYRVSGLSGTTDSLFSKAW